MRPKSCPGTVPVKNWAFLTRHPQIQHKTKIILLLKTVLRFPALFCLYFMQTRVDYVLRIFRTQVTKKKRPVRPVFPDCLSGSYDYGETKRRNSRGDSSAVYGILPIGQRCYSFSQYSIQDRMLQLYSNSSPYWSDSLLLSLLSLSLLSLQYYRW